MVVVEAVVTMGFVKQSSVTETVGVEPGSCSGARGGGRWWP